MNKEMTKIALIITASILVGWVLMAIGTWLLWQVDWKVAVGVWCLTIGYAIEQGASKVKNKWKI